MPCFRIGALLVRFASSRGSDGLAYVRKSNESMTKVPATLSPQFEHWVNDAAHEQIYAVDVIKLYRRGRSQLSLLKAKKHKNP